MNENLITITREDAVRMVGMAHHGFSWETAERMTRVAMLFGPEPQGEAEDTVVVLDRLTMPAYDWSELKALHEEHERRYPAAA